ncbi:MAG: hypothetical protein U0798_14530 [Gemmataceae bacterium]
MMHDRSRDEHPFEGSSGDRDGDDDRRDDGDMIPLHGVVLPVSESDAQPTNNPSDASLVDDSANTLTLRPFDDGVPARDFQPRLLRFGEAA